MSDWIQIDAATDFSDDAYHEIDAATKTISKITDQTIVAGENLSQFIKFQIPRYYDGIDLAQKEINIIYLSPDKYSDINEAVNKEYNDEYIRFGWLVPYAACSEEGALTFAVEFVGSEYCLKTQTAEIKVKSSLDGSNAVPEPTEQSWYVILQEQVSRTLDRASTVLDSLGKPTTAQTPSDMEDESAVYVYTGEDGNGYRYGYWYYHDGTSWREGGLYASTALLVDTTLSVSGRAADAAAVGTELSGKVNAVTGKGLSTNDYSNEDKEAVETAAAITNAESAGSGKALTAKTITDGKVIDWQFKFIPISGDTDTGAAVIGKENVELNGRLLASSSTGLNSVAEGISTTAQGNGCHAEGTGTIASHSNAHAEGLGTQAIANAAHAEGFNTVASSDYAHAEGAGTRATGYAAHAEGGGTTVSGEYAHAEGSGSTASNNAAHAEGSGTQATANSAHAEGGGAQARAYAAHAEGGGTTASGECAHAEGGGTTASGAWSHAEGGSTCAIGPGSHAEGTGTYAKNAYQHVGGKFNVHDPSTANSEQIGTYAEIIGNGISDTQRSNARTLDWQGNEALAGSLTLGMGTNDEITISAAQLRALLALLQ